jgi:hypothetical protein
MATKRNRFDASMFKATKFNTAEDKAKFGDDLLDFVEANFAESKFTNKFYERLHNTFGFIAHCDRAGFYSTYFITTAGKIDFLQHLLDHPSYGDPGYTYSDVEQAIQQVLLDSVFLECYKAQNSVEGEQAERNTLSRLKTKYEPACQPIVTGESIPPLSEFLSGTFPVETVSQPAQGVLF